MDIDETHQVTLTIMAGASGGLVIYDVTTASRLVFGGNLDETTGFIRSVMGELIVEQDKQGITQQVTPLPATFRKTALRTPAKLADAWTHHEMHEETK